ncbi:MAG: GNAT family N-acetyltransferase [Clostridiales bacterium]
MSIKFEILNSNHIEIVSEIALKEYYEEKSKVSILPEENFYESICKLVSELADHKLGVVAVEGKKILGFLTCHKPIKNYFGKTLGTFSPIHAHGTIKENRKNIYSLLYQQTSKIWVKQEIYSHAIALYKHNDEAVSSFFENGFGLRCIDAIRTVEAIKSKDFPDINFFELRIDSIDKLVPLKNNLIKHLQETPIYIPLFFKVDEEKMRKNNSEKNSRYFVAEKNDNIIAYIEIMNSGENFACTSTNMKNICSAYMYPKYRNNGIFTKLISYLMEILDKEGYKKCGVDFESLNPTAKGFWLKYFTAYTYSVVRRIDERINDN